MKRYLGVILALVALGSPWMQQAHAADNPLPAKASAAYFDTWGVKAEESTLFCQGNTSTGAIALYLVGQPLGSQTAQVAGIAQVHGSSEIMSSVLAGTNLFARVEMFAATVSGPGAVANKDWVLGLVELSEIPPGGGANAPLCSFVFPLAAASSPDNALKQFQERDAIIQQARQAAMNDQTGPACMNNNWLGTDGFQCCRCAQLYGMGLAGCSIASEQAFWQCMAWCGGILGAATAACLKVAFAGGPIAIGACLILGGFIGLPACLGACLYWSSLAEKGCVIAAQQDFLRCLSEHGCTEAPGG